MLGAVRYPYMPTDVDRAIRRVALDIGREETFNQAPVGVFFGTPGVEADDPYFGGLGPRRTGCISCGNCNNGCGHNAKNKLTTNYLYLAEQLGAEVHDLHEVHDLVPLDGGGFEVHARHPGWAQRAVHRQRHTFTAEQVIVAAHAYGSAKLLNHLQHRGRLTGLSSELGQRARTNSEQLLYVTRSHGEWKSHPDKIRIQPGSVTITSGVWPDEVTSIEPTTGGSAATGSRSSGPITSTVSRRIRLSHGSRSWSDTRAGCWETPTRATGPSARSSRSARRRSTPRSSSIGTTACCTAGRPGRSRPCTSRPSKPSWTAWRDSSTATRRRSPPRS